MNNAADKLRLYLKDELDTEKLGQDPGRAGQREWPGVGGVPGG